MPASRPRQDAETHEDRPAAAAAEQPALEVTNVWKRFPGVVALHDVSLAIPAGEVRGLVGENGAGKSTLIKVISGALAPDEGEVFICGEQLVRPTPARAEQRGLAVIHQEREIAPDVSIAENALLGRLPTVAGELLSWGTINSVAKRLVARLGLTADVRRPAGSLSVAEQQEVTIARALGGGQRVLIMDEPTGSLGPAESLRLLEIVRTLKQAGTTIIYISHHLEELFAITDNVTVMRDGAVVGTFPTAETTKDKLVGHMFGRQARNALPSRKAGEHDHGQPVVSARGLHHGRALQGVDLELRKGEILCVTGGVGSGQRELAEVIAGARMPEQGSVEVKGRPVRSPRDAIRQGVAFVPEDRKGEGILPDLDIVENVDLVRMNMQSSPFVSPRRRRSRAMAGVEAIQTRYADVSMPAHQLSGGNQQKLLLARWLSVGAEIFVLDEPTAGIDVNAKVDIYQIINRLAADGISFVLFSSDYEEMRLMADRVVVLSKGRVVSEVDREELTEERVFGYETNDLATA